MAKPESRLILITGATRGLGRAMVAGFVAAGSPEMNPCGFEANRRNLEVAIDYVHRQRLIPRRYTVEELFA